METTTSENQQATLDVDDADCDADCREWLAKNQHHLDTWDRLLAVAVNATAEARERSQSLESSKPDPERIVAFVQSVDEIVVLWATAGWAWRTLCEAVVSLSETTPLTDPRLKTVA